MDTLDDLVKGIVNGLKTYPINLPGTALHYGLQVTTTRSSNRSRVSINSHVTDESVLTVS